MKISVMLISVVTEAYSRPFVLPNGKSQVKCFLYQREYSMHWKFKRGVYKSLYGGCEITF